jgi:arsenite methyltransferase
VGTGDGLVAFGAFDHLGPTGHVIFSDISTELLDHCRIEAERRGLVDRCTFVSAPAADLSPVPDRAADVVTTRSVLIYVADKASAFAEAFRVLRPGGRLSIFEPINRYFGDRRERMFGFDLTGIEDVADRVAAVYDRLQPPASDPMLNFGERDLLDLAERSGFDDVHLDLSVEIARPKTASWASFMNTPPNPLVPSLAEAMAQELTPQEATRFEAHLRPRVEGGQGVKRSAVAYLSATKPFSA